MTRACTQRLNAARRAAEKAGDPPDRTMFIVWFGNRAVVHGPGAETLWEGTPHCGTCARIEAIKAQSAQKSLI